MVRIIINADDLGKSHEVNEAISDALNKRVITSSTIMANTSNWDEVHRIIEEHREASFGVHLDLTEGPSITNSEVLHRYGIIGDDGCFTGKIRQVDMVDDTLAEALYYELAEQVNKVKIEHNIKITHIDGHHHVHALEQLAPIVLRVVKDNGVAFMRNRYTWPIVFPHLGLKKRIQNRRWRKMFKKESGQFKQL